MLGVGAAGEHDRAAAWNEPSDPGAERAVHANVVAAGDVPPVVLAGEAHVNHSGALDHESLDLGGGQLRRCGGIATEQRGALTVDGGHVPVVSGISLLVEHAGEEWHHLGGQKKRIRGSLLAEGGLVTPVTAGSAEGPAAMR